MDSLCYSKLGNFKFHDQNYTTLKTMDFSNRKYAPLDS